MHILVVDDDPLMIGWMSRSLRHAGYEVTVSGGAAAACKELIGGGYDMLLTDLYMPEMDGLELIRAVRAQQAGLKILAISGGGREFSSEYALNCARYLGADSFLRKPFDVHQLLAAVGALVGEQSPHTQSKTGTHDDE